MIQLFKLLFLLMIFFLFSIRLWMLLRTFYGTRGLFEICGYSEPSLFHLRRFAEAALQTVEFRAKGSLGYRLLGLLEISRFKHP